MNNRNKWVVAAVTSVFILTTSTAIAATNGSATEQSTEKCYGIVKAGQNDCATAKQSCAGSSTKDGQSDAFIFLPKGACDKIVGGSITAK